jgi:hypothetical protein
MFVGNIPDDYIGERVEKLVSVGILSNVNWLKVTGPYNYATVKYDNKNAFMICGRIAHDDGYIVSIKMLFIQALIFV